jgi:hypothetical protein
VACATQASDRGHWRDDIKNVGKWRLERSGKYPVNKNAEDFDARSASFRGDAQHRTRNLEVPGSLASLAPRNDIAY